MLFKYREELVKVDQPADASTASSHRRKYNEGYEKLGIAFRHSPKTHELKLIAALGVADWYLNVRSKSALQIEVGRVVYEPDQRILTVAEIADLERDFRPITIWSQPAA